MKKSGGDGDCSAFSAESWSNQSAGCWWITCEPKLHVTNVLDWEVDQTGNWISKKCTKKIEISKSQLTHNPEKMRFRRVGDISDSTAS